jgi:hypothetical protein
VTVDDDFHRDECRLNYEVGWWTGLVLGALAVMIGVFVVLWAAAR